MKEYHNPSRIIVHLTLHGDEFDSNYVTQRAGIHPNYTRQKNEVLPNGKIFGHTEWGIETSWVDGMDLDAVLELILPTVREKQAVLKQIAQDCHAKWDLLIGVEIWNEIKPDLFFSRENIQLFANLGIEVGIDYYCYGFENDDEHIH